MRQIFNGYFYKAAMGAGLLVLIGLVAANIWLWQSDDGSGTASGPGQESSSGSDLPGLPSRGASPNSSAAGAAVSEGDSSGGSSGSKRFT